MKNGFFYTRRGTWAHVKKTQLKHLEKFKQKAFKFLQFSRAAVQRSNVSSKSHQEKRKRATPFQKMPLLGKDHLARGRGDIQLFNQVAYTCADLTVQYTSYRLLFSDFGPWCASVFVKYLGITAPSALLDTPLGEARPLQAYLLLGGIALYFAKVGE